MLLVALIWSVTPVLDKVGSQMTNVMGHTAFVALGIAVAFFVGRSALDRSPLPILRELGTVPLLLIGAAFVNVLAMVFQLSAYHFIDVAYVETVKRAVGVIASVAIGTLYFGEGDPARRLLAAAVMAAGVAMVILSG